jgi:hypothetical protein
MSGVLRAAKMLDLITFGNKCVFVVLVISYFKMI